MEGVDLNLADYMKFVFALIFVMALIVLAALAARRFGFGMPLPHRHAARRRLGIVESMNVDGKRRLVLIKRDDVEHLILLGSNGELLIENGIAPPKNAFSRALDDAAQAADRLQKEKENAS